MGAGKSVIGNELAYTLGFRFVDTDEWIESRTCKTIPQIFSEEGEDFFRIKEKECIEFLLDQDNIVVATGGGTPCFNDSMSLMNELGVTIYLSAQIQTLTDRLWVEKLARPKLSGCQNKEELSEFISNHLSDREIIYKKSKKNISVDGKSVKQVASEIKKALR